MNVALKEEVINKLLAQRFDCYCEDGALVIHIPATLTTIRIGKSTTISVVENIVAEVDTPATLYKIARGFCRWAWLLGSPAVQKVFRKVVPLLIAFIKRL